MTERGKSVERLWRAFLAFRSAGGKPSTQRIDRAAFVVLHAVLAAMRHPSRRGAEMLEALEAVATGKGDSAAWNFGLVAAVTTVQELVGEERAHRANRVWGARHMPGPEDAVFALLFEGLTDAGSVEAFEALVQKLPIDRRRTPAGAVARLICDALRRGVVFPGSQLSAKSKLPDVQKMVTQAVARKHHATRG